MEKDSKDSFDFKEINLIDQLKDVWSEKYVVLIITLVFGAVGYFHYISGPTEYRSTATLIQETDASGGGGGGNALLRSVFGGGNFSNIGITATARGYSPPPLFLYPEIVNSTQFQLEIINEKIEFETVDSALTLLEYFDKYFEPSLRDRVYGVLRDYTIRLPITILRHIRNIFSSFGSSSSVEREQTQGDAITEPVMIEERFTNLSGPERRAIAEMRARILLTIGPGVTTIATTLPDPTAAAVANHMIIEKIQKFMTEYRVEKAKQNLEFVLEQYDEARERYEEAQYDLAMFEDQNVVLTSAIARLELEHLNNKRNLKFNIYNSISQQVEEARLTVQQQTPVFNTLEKPDYPRSPYTGASDLVLIFSIIIGFFVGVVYVIVKKLYHSFVHEAAVED